MFDRNKHLQKQANKKYNCKCLICNRVFTKYGALGSHIHFAHKISSKQYFNRFFPDKVNICSCGKECAFISIKHGYGSICSSTCIEAKSGENNNNFGKRHANMHSQEFKDKISKRTIERIKSGELLVGSTKGKTLNLNDEQRQKRRDWIAKVNRKGFENKGGRCKFYDIDGVKLQGRYELYYYLKNNKKPKKYHQKIKTPFGWYTPDFDFNEKFIEIKSTYTIKLCIKNGQYNKIKWVSNNIKTVKIVVLKESIVNLYLGKVI